MDHDTKVAIESLDSQLNTLRSKRADILQQLEQVDCEICEAEIKRARIHNNLVPISRLPSELLSYIFLICQQDFPSFHILASRVCNHWRNLAQSTPLLWADIRIRLDHESRVPSLLHKLEIWLDRSGPTSPYAVRIYVECKNLDFSSFLKLLTAHISRCYMLYISAALHTRAYLLLRQYFESLYAPQLEYLGLHVNFVDNAPHERVLSATPLIFKEGVPLLRYLSLSGLAAPLCPPSSGTITTLHLDGVHMMALTALNFKEILSATPGLVNLSLLGIIVNESAESSPTSAVKLPRLRSLRFRPIPRDSNSTALLSALPLKQLDSLVLCEVDGLGQFQFPNVKNLCLYDCSFGIEQIGHIMLAFSTVESLTVEYSSLVYMALAIEGEPVWWPKLRTLCVREMAAREAAMLLRMVRCRQSVQHTLQAVWMDDSSRRRAHTSKVLDDLKSLTNVHRASLSPEPWPAGSIFDEVDGFWDAY
ncbi:hypothetical protein GYMLUDRAFT_72703 [Collybiopsis luxurians FD-317 M1]|uniref:F-box domain-containing protein n=1 Tax=Collybiopsis luxurians FD-317 M1 TaxID=944289 RepID=A0A0D0CIH5_9AGAR|nr:hypothetical protein GYMLUDRAFT_72703 [Collybiopsis luxurians FD-317 M1]